jgi:hypothetical protein
VGRAATQRSAKMLGLSSGECNKYQLRLDIARYLLHRLRLNMLQYATIHFEQVQVESRLSLILASIPNLGNEQSNWR